MPEGHSVHRIAAQFRRYFVGRTAAVTSPQGRFGDAAILSGHVLTGSFAVGKHLFLEFDHGVFLHVHLGIYGAWDFAGAVALDDTVASAGGRMGQTAGRGTVVGANEDSPWSIGAPRRTRLRMGEDSSGSEDSGVDFPPEPIGQVRCRILTDDAVADLRGPTVCEILDRNDVERVIAGLGPDPIVEPDGGSRFAALLSRTRTPIAQALMNQKIVAGIGNVYRAEMLFRAGINPYQPANELGAEIVRELWSDWTFLLSVGVETGQMLTMDGLSGEDYDRALAHRADRHWVYHRTGQPCRRCGTPIAMDIVATRKLYFCPSCQGGTP
jgi:endonuclease VIII